MADDSFVHLHVHTEYSMLDGASKLGPMVDKVAGDGQPGVAITDHGVLFGLVDFHHAARRAGVNPIMGCELYQAHGSRRDQQRTPNGDRYYHLTALATDDTGYRNLMAISSAAYLEGMWYKPRVDRELLAQHNEGLVVLSGCLGGEVNQALLRDDEAGAKQALADFRDILGPERFFVEQMDHGISEQRRNWPRLESLAKDLGLRTVVTNDSHYTEAEDAQAHDALLCIQTGAELSQENRFRFSGPDYYLRTADEMWRMFGERCPDALRATLDINEMCDVRLEFGQDLLPRFPTTGGRTEAEQLRDDVLDGAARLYGTPLPGPVQERIDYELRVIEDMGFPAYFLIVADLCRHAREVGIRVGPGRGSAGGSVVAYCTGITTVDPIHHGLIFERFLNPARNEMPDIDIDFDDRRRAEMIQYSADRYGADQVAQVITFGTIKAKSAIRDAARVLGPDELGVENTFQVGDTLAKKMPPAAQGKEWPLLAVDGKQSAYDLSSELRDAKDDPVHGKVLGLAEKLEGLKRQHGIHAAAVIIGAKPLVETVPLLRTDNGEVVTQYEMKACESLGLLKMDFLGLRNLTVIADAERHIRTNRGEQVRLDDPTFLGQMEDPGVYELLGTGHTLGVFQLDSTGMQSLVRKLKPTRFEDISALLALYRPGPLKMDMHITYADRKNGLEGTSYDHPDLEPILGDTYGVIVYQEQIMQIATDIAGFSMSDADGLRKAVGKKKRQLMESFKGQFIEGGEANGYESALMRDLWDLIEKFAEYGFNKAHTVAYGVVSYQTAWLKAHYPVEYMAALLTSVKNNKDTKPIYLNECRRLEIPVLPPDVNVSEADFAPDGDSIRFGLTAVRGVGESVVDAIVRARQDEGPFTDFRDFCAKVDGSVLNKRTIENLALAGAFTGLGHTRKGLVAAYEPIIDAAQAVKKAEEAGQHSLFDGLGEQEPVVELDDGVEIGSEEFGKARLLAAEREMLGLYVSDHPLFGAERLLEQECDVPVAGLRDKEDGETVTIGGVLTSLAKKFTRKGDTYLTATVEDLTGAVEVVFWPTVYRVAHEVLTEDTVLLLTGRVEKRDEAVKFTANRVTEPDLSEVRGAPVQVHFEVGQCTRDAVVRLRRVLEEHRGHVPVHLTIDLDEGLTRWQLGDDLRVARHPGLFGELKMAFGPDAVRDGTSRSFSAD